MFFARALARMLQNPCVALTALRAPGTRSRIEGALEMELSSGNPTSATRRKYELPALPYGYADLEPAYSRELLELHHDKHHAAYVKGVNEALEGLAHAREKGDWAELNQLQKNLAFHLSGHVLHSLFWRNMSPQSNGTPAGELQKCIERDFGRFEPMRDQMKEAAIAVQGSGWAALSWEPLARRLVVEQIYDHQGNTGIGTVPLLVLDMWEHAYYLQYRNEKKKWVTAFWDIVNWTDVDERYQKVRALDIGL
jgi:Fe-Mn family superoxide dismutase